ncbi:MAG: hypothetical protein U5K56_13815 [Halioglobus sp.]|nr:hypothetical protein [Halioglobus sp.]
MEAGDAVPADLQLVGCRGSGGRRSPPDRGIHPVGKEAGDELDGEAVITDRSNMVFAGSTVMSGNAAGVVCGVGERTQVGQIAESLASGEAQAPPLVLKLRRFTRQIALFVLLAVILLSVTQALQGVAVEQVFFLGVALAVSAIPAGLPIAITVAMGMASNPIRRTF